MRNWLGLKSSARAAAGPPARGARVWSNREIARLGPAVTGDVINVSAWKDEDKEGGFYRNYFPGAASYATSNFDGWRGDEGATDHGINLEEPAPTSLQGRFDLVFNHTTLEHVFDVHQAMRTITALSRDAVLVVVPFMQHLHGPEDGDFWRFSPYCLRRLFGANGLTVVYEAAGPRAGRIRYLTAFAVRSPERWTGRLPEAPGDAEKVLRESL